MKDLLQSSAMSAKLVVRAIAGLLCVGSPALPVVAQDLEFEQVGDIPIDAEEIDFDHDSTLWAITSRALYRLQAGAPVWEEVNDSFAGIDDNILVLSPDTILLGLNFNQARSTDGGQSFIGVYLDGGRQFAASVSGPNHGIILSGTFGGGTGIIYSTDRGASFTEATFTVSTSSTPFMEGGVEHSSREVAITKPDYVLAPDNPKAA